MAAAVPVAPSATRPMAVALAGAVATQVLAGARSSGEAGLSSVAGRNGRASSSVSLACSAASRSGVAPSCCSIRCAIAELPALRNHSRARPTSPFCASARPR